MNKRRRASREYREHGDEGIEAKFKNDTV